MGLEQSVLAFIVHCVGRVLSNEVAAGIGPLANWLVRRAAKRLPAAVRERYEAEQLFLIQDTKSPLGKLFHAVSFALHVRESIRACTEFDLPLDVAHENAPAVLVHAVAGRYVRGAVLVPDTFSQPGHHRNVYRHERRVGDFDLKAVIDDVVTPAVIRHVAGEKRNPNKMNLARFRKAAEGWSVVQLAPDGTEVLSSNVVDVDMQVKLKYESVQATLVAGKAVSAINSVPTDARVFTYHLGTRPFMDVILRQDAAPETRTDFEALSADGKVVLYSEMLFKEPPNRG